MRIIGIDTGGTCTDAVLYDTEEGITLCAGKAQTTRTNLERGIVNARDTIDPELLKTAEMAALSTTLATNAAVENKGARAKLLLIGFDPKIMEHLKEIYASYGLNDMTQFIVLDAKPEGAYAHPYDPDWEDLRRQAVAYFDDCDSVGIVQMSPRANGGRFELTAMKILKEELHKPVTIACDISNETDILKTCAGTLLNARLVPLMSELLEAVRRAMKDRGLECPVSIVRSDGIIMSEEMAMRHPVETLMSGPAASAVGGCALAKVRDGIIVDMGGTTTDIVCVRSGVPEKADKGIYIGKWKTMVKGIRVATFGLGGDSAVRYKDNELYLDTERVMPISALAAEYETVLPALKELAEQHYYCSRPVHEFYVLQKEIAGRSGYTDREQTICELLKQGPIMMKHLCEKLGIHPLFLNTERLESEGIVLRSGVTPTDMMILKGDFQLYKGEAAETAAKCLAANSRTAVEKIPDAVYELVTHKMYRSIGKVLLSSQYPKQKKLLEEEALYQLLDCFYEQAKKQAEGSNIEGSDAEGSDTEGSDAKGGRGEIGDGACLRLTAASPLIGVGAPVHVFLPRVAKLLFTEAVLPEHEDVANAIGAAVSRRVATGSLRIKAEYDGGMFSCFSMHEDGRRFAFKEKEKAIRCGREILLRSIRKRAALQGIEGEPQITMEMEENRVGHVREGALLDIFLRAEAVQA